MHLSDKYSDLPLHSAMATPAAPHSVHLVIPPLRKPPSTRHLLRLLLGQARLRTGVASLDFVAAVLSLQTAGLFYCLHSLCFQAGVDDGLTQAVHGAMLAFGASEQSLSWRTGHTLLLLVASTACMALSYHLLLREWCEALHASALAVLRPRAAAEAAAARPADWRQADGNRRSSMAAIGNLVPECWSTSLADAWPRARGGLRGDVGAVRPSPGGAGGAAAPPETAAARAPGGTRRDTAEERLRVERLVWTVDWCVRFCRLEALVDRDDLVVVLCEVHHLMRRCRSRLHGGRRRWRGWRRSWWWLCRRRCSRSCCLRLLSPQEEAELHRGCVRGAIRRT